jgi:hypothetical protein
MIHVEHMSHTDRVWECTSDNGTWGRWTDLRHAEQATTEGRAAKAGEPCEQSSCRDEGLELGRSWFDNAQQVECTTRTLKLPGPRCPRLQYCQHSNMSQYKIRVN